MNLTPLFWLAVVLAGAEWVAVWRSWRKVSLFTKPGMMLALIAWFIQATQEAHPGLLQGPLLWFGLGLSASLVGDVLLMLPERFFLPGLVAFLCGHLCYLVGFNSRLPVLGWILLIPGAVVIMGSGFVFRSILRGLNLSPESRGLRLPVILYEAVISLMVVSALVSFWRPGWTPTAVLLVSVGALLFYISDSILAIGKFVRRLKWGDLAVMVTYQLAQVALAAGALLAYGALGDS